MLAASRLIFAQAAETAHITPLDFSTIQVPPIPADSLELVTGPVQAMQDAEQRIAALGLLDKAHDLSNVRAQPYDLKTSFSASGGLASDGNWSLEDIARGHAYRWTASGPNYSAINLYPAYTTNGLYGNQLNGLLPLRYSVPDSCDTNAPHVDRLSGCRHTQSGTGVPRCTSRNPNRNGLTRIFSIDGFTAHTNDQFLSVSIARFSSSASGVLRPFSPLHMLRSAECKGQSRRDRDASPL